MPLMLLVLLLLIAVDADAARRAVLVGINDYSASRLTQLGPAADRDWRNLLGAVTDVTIVRDMLITRHGFNAADIVTITDQDATRAAILRALGQLAASAAKGDTLFFYYAGHGSQVQNSQSDELDGFDESLVPADSRAGAPDIRDKELRRPFNRILDRGARLTVLLDACHSGSGARGRVTRSIRRDERDVADATPAGPHPEERGALILSATQDFDPAYETRDTEGRFHGAFSWAWIRAMRDATPNEPAADTFLRAQARVRSEMPFQKPVMAGNADARSTPFLGTTALRRDERTTVAVEAMKRDGTVLLQGGWAHGLDVGSELQVVGNPNIRLTVTAMLGIGRSAARATAPVASGTLVQLHPENFWHRLQSPVPSPYHLRIRRAADRRWVDDSVTGGTECELVLEAAAPNPQPRYHYAFVIDSAGNNILLFPRRGSVENRFPQPSAKPPISLAMFEIVPPYGIDTYFLLSTAEPLPNPWILGSTDARAPFAGQDSWSLHKVTVTSKSSR